MIFVGPDELRPTHHIKLTDGENEVGLIVVDSKGDPNPEAIVRAPMVRTALKTTSGNTQYSDFEPPWTPVDQSDWSGGRGQDDFEKDVTRFYDSNRLNTMFSKKLFLAPQEVYSTGLRSHDSYLPGSVKWAALMDGDRPYIANKFAASASYSVKYIEIILKRVGTPTTALTVELCDNSGDEPHTVLKTITCTTTEITDILSRQYRFTITSAQAVVASTYYWIKVYSSGTDEDHWEVAVNDASGTSKESDDGTIWTASLVDLYYRASAAETGYKTNFFKYKQSLYCVRHTIPGVAPKLYINGDRGCADSNAGALSTLIDATKSWATNEWAGYVVMIIEGLGYAEDITYRTIASNTATALTVSSPWLITHDTTTSYIILGSNKWTEITGHGLTQPITDILVVNNIAYFCQGDSTFIRRMRWYNNSGTATYEYDDDDPDGSTNRALKMVVARDATNGERIWKANNVDATADKSVAVAPIVAWGTNLTFATAVVLKDSKYGKINELASYYDDVEQLWIFREGMIHKLTPTTTLPDEFNLLEMYSMMDAINCRAVAQHSSYIYFNLGNGLERYYNQQLDDVGPNIDEGLPAERKGYISYLLPYPGRLYAAIDGETSNYSSILATTGSGWHEIYRSPMPGMSINSMDFETVPGQDHPDKIWFNLGDDLVWIYSPSRGVNPLQDSNYRFVHEGSLETSNIHSGLYDLMKFYHSLKIFAENLVEDEIYIRAYYKIDDDTTWTLVDTGDFDTSPMTERDLVESLGLTGKRLKYRIVVYTNNNSVTPIIKSTVLETVTRVPVKYSYAFAYRAVDGEVDLRAEPEGMTAEEKQELLDSWAANLTVLTMYSNFEEYNDITCFVDPTPLSPYAEYNQQYIGKLTVVEA